VLKDTLAQIDAYNSRDPRIEVEVTAAGPQDRPKELLYSERMSRWLHAVYPEANEALQIAVRAQHLGRWESPRSDYPMDKPGYKAWRTDLLKRHARLAGEIMAEVGYDAVTVERVQFIIRKRKLKSDADTQALEDVACLVFLEHVFADFGQSHTDEKLTDIVRKTWFKMSTRGHAAAADIELGERERRIVEAALAQ
jgi:hypothetical protein